jgi:RES domain-containing protein
MMAGRDPVWDPAVVVDFCIRTPWQGSVWRCHGRQYAGDNADGSLKVTGRFNRGRDKYPAHECWMALYTSSAQHVALAERIRHTSPSTLEKLANQRMSRLRIELQDVVIACAPTGCEGLAVPGLNIDDICRPIDYRAPHELALAARSIAEALLVPSCTGFPEGNLIVFPDRLRPGSIVRVEESVDPNLYIDWDAIQSWIAEFATITGAARFRRRATHRGPPAARQTP